MKVRIEFTVDIDPEVWMLNYGVDAKEVRDDVKVHVINGAQDHLRDLGLWNEVKPSEWYVKIIQPEGQDSVVFMRGPFDSEFDATNAQTQARDDYPRADVSIQQIG